MARCAAECVYCKAGVAEGEGLLLRFPVDHVRPRQIMASVAAPNERSPSVSELLRSRSAEEAAGIRMPTEAEIEDAIEAGRIARAKVESAVQPKKIASRRLFYR